MERVDVEGVGEFDADGYTKTYFRPARESQRGRTRDRPRLSEPEHMLAVARE